MDFLITPRHRWIYVAILGVMAVTLFTLFSNVSVNVENIYVGLFLTVGKYCNDTTFTYCTSSKSFHTSNFCWPRNVATKHCPQNLCTHLCCICT